MADRRYPLFTGGQTLTRDDLNLLRDFLDGQDQVLARAIGFGIVAGLTGTLGAPDDAGRRKLTVAHGLAVDQPGRMLMLEADSVIEDAANATGTASFDFVDPAQGGVTPVLVFFEGEPQAPQCDETGCAGHSAIRTRSATVVLAAGRLKTPQTDFATEPLLRDESPLTIDADGSVQGNFDRLRDAIRARLAAAGVTLSQPSAERLAQLTISGALLPAIRQYRAAFLNHVLFAALDLLRVLALSTPSPRDATAPGVALGWITVEAGTPTWRPEYRHDFEPPEGLSNALFGSGALDPPTLMLNRLESLVRSYAEPAVPAPQDPPKPAPDKDDFHKCPKGKKALARLRMNLGLKVDCIDLVYPPAQIRDDWRNIYLEEAPVLKGPGHGVIDPVEIDVLYDIDPLDFAQAGVFSLHPALGGKADTTRASIEQFIRDRGVRPDVLVRTQAEAHGIEGFRVQGAISLGDTLVLVKDQHGKIVEIGRVPNQQALKSAGGVLAEVGTEAKNAAASALKAEQAAGGAMSKVQILETSLTHLKSGELTEFPALGGLAQQVANMVTRSDVDVVRKDLRAEFDLKLAAQDTKVVSKVQALEDRTQDLQGDIRRTGEHVEKFQQSILDSVAKVTAVEEVNRELTRNVDKALEMVKISHQRVDDILRPRAVTPRSVEASRLNASMVDFLGTMRRSLVESAPVDRRDAVRAELAGGEEAFDELSRHIERDQPLTVSHGAELSALVESLVAAAEAARLPAGELARLRGAADALTERLRGPS
ncbi:hypothetical protein F7R91_09905 [Streptomyces luteolifulvus]|uniref:Uncharacterized protein n=1 Tax=Streptomyces luteolifulvus TaxID=2615112 RepID=A0A6H9V7E0_9ACTN|nr:hypothetical protein [Streptomyces luteolifulvus]KAB1148206.1 hypothetical protein F7R91_09905 [Streptomyces luteolifulvus]